MDSKSSSPIVYDLVLVGCGHAHVHVLKMIGMLHMKHRQRQHPSLTEMGIQMTIISSHSHTPYSGMLPGYIAGHYADANDIHLNVVRLARFANVRFIRATVNRISYDSTSPRSGGGGGGYIYTTDQRPPIRYDCLSIDIGTSPSTTATATATSTIARTITPSKLPILSSTEPALDDGGEITSATVTAQQPNDNSTTTTTAAATVIPVKPIADLCQYWDVVVQQYLQYLQESTNVQWSDSRNNSETRVIKKTIPYTIAIVGGGAGGIELALSIHHRLMTITASSTKRLLSTTTSSSSSLEMQKNISKYLQIMIITRGTTIFESSTTHNHRVIQKFQRILQERNIVVHCNAEVDTVIPVSYTLTSTSENSTTTLSPHIPHIPKQQQQCQLPRHEMEHPVADDENNSDMTANHNNNKISTTTTATTTSIVRPRKQIILKHHSNYVSPIIVDVCFSCITGKAASWLSDATPFTTTEVGNFLRVHPTYECIHHTGVFASGDCCHMDKHPRPKAGVFAVRAGPILYTNLLRYILQNKRRLQYHHPQSTYLSLISTGNQYAVAVKGRFFCTEGKYLWNMKDYIDRKWLDKYSTDLPDLEIMMKEQQQSQSKWWKIQFNRNQRFRTTNLWKHNNININKSTQEVIEAFRENPMRCGGCGSKVGASIVSRVLQKVYDRQVLRAHELGLPVIPPPIDHDDAAITYLPMMTSENDKRGAIIQTIDYFREMITDPYIFGKVVAVHALSDIHAMGTTAQTALVLAVVPFAADDNITESTLLHLLSGVSDILQNENVQLVGGHTCEGIELACGLSIQGYSADPTTLWRKRGGRIGDHIIITKPIGTGALFAAEMRAKANGEHVQEAIEYMLQSNHKPSSAARDFCNRRAGTTDSSVVNACTDVTGFGLIGHLLEMLLANETGAGNSTSTESIGAELHINQIPFYRGGIDASTKLIYSSLQKQNERNRRAVFDHTTSANTYPIQYPLLFDPQTAGGLLFFVHPKHSDDFVSYLRKEGDASHASVIGEVVPYLSTTTIDESSNGTTTGTSIPAMSSEPCIIGNHNKRASSENRIHIV